MTNTAPRPGVFAELAARGLVHTSTDERLAGHLDDRQFTAYCGFDPTAPSLQIGNLVPLLTLARLQRFGHRPIVVLGGGTGMIGDPSGKSSERNLLGAETLAQNIAAQRAQFRQLLDFSDGPAEAEMVNNLDWLAGLDLIGFLRDVGKHFPMSVMLSRESVSRRIGSKAGISYTEFSYQVLQAYDFLHLYRQRGCKLQIGGSDQLGNIVAGAELIRRTIGPQAQAYGLVFPLLETRSGQKMGKTADGTIWLDPALTSVYDFYQYLYNFADEDVIPALKVFTYCPLDQIADIGRQQDSDPAARAGQRLLADSVTELVHGRKAAEGARAQQAAMFGVSDGERRANFTFSRAELDAGIDLQKALVASGLARSNSQARRLLAQNAVRVNDQRRQSGVIGTGDLGADGLILLASGRRNRRLIGALDG